MKWYLYILQSEKDRGLYIGITRNIEKRLEQHNSGKTFSTRARRPFVLMSSEEYSSCAEARQREKFLKSYSGAREKMDIVENLGE
jgi:putative endonuclease